ncbi:MAG: fasciclin domain-containing protein [Gemmatimonadetes bacterium]|nr:fasciclin domain-containing protein [Gemmatimonadota bacterium]
MASHRLWAYLRPALFLAPVVALAAGCGGAASSDGGAPAAGGAASVKDDVSNPDIVKIAVGSKDHTTLVAALKAAGLVDVMSSSGPYTVFAPTNAAFEKLPAGTVEGLLKPDQKAKLSGILQHHVMTSALDLGVFENGQVVGMVDGGRATISRKDGATYIDDAKVIASVRASNGWVHVVDAVVLPKAP